MPAHYRQLNRTPNIPVADCGSRAPGCPRTMVYCTCLMPKSHNKLPKSDPKSSNGARTGVATRPHGTTLILGVIGAAIALSSLTFNVLQWRWNQTSTEVLERPLVYPISQKIYTPDQRGEEFQLAVQLKNAGETPLVAVELGGCVAYSPVQECDFDYVPMRPVWEKQQIVSFAINAGTRVDQAQTCLKPDIIRYRVAAHTRSGKRVVSDSFSIRITGRPNYCLLPAPKGTVRHIVPDWN